MPKCPTVYVVETERLNMLQDMDKILVNNNRKIIAIYGLYIRPYYAALKLRTSESSD